LDQKSYSQDLRTRLEVLSITGCCHLAILRHPPSRD
jgi:hypothetical protein